MELSEEIKKHFYHPQNVGEIENPDGSGSIHNPVCGDTTKLYLRIKDGVIEDAKFLSFGCAVTIASASVFTQQIKGRQISQLLTGSDEEVIKRLIHLIESHLGEIPSLKLHCPPATVQVFLEAISEYMEKEKQFDISTRIRKMIPLVFDYYKRGEKEESSP